MASQIQPSSSAHFSPAFIISKADPIVLPCWVNDHCQLNLNTIPDSHPLPCIDEILWDYAKGKLFGKIDMTNSFFQTKVHSDNIHLTTSLTSWRLYKWSIMPMGVWNAPSCHQHCITGVLHHLIRKICHIYLNDIIIWSQTLTEHETNVCKVLEALWATSLYCLPKKTSWNCIACELIEW